MHDVLVPRENVNDTTVAVVKIFFKSGETVVPGDIVLQIETSKTNVDIQSPHGGYLKHDLEVGQQVEVGSTLFSVLKELNSFVADAHINEKDQVDNNLQFSKNAMAIVNSKKLSLDKVKKLGWITSGDISNASQNFISDNQVNIMAKKDTAFDKADIVIPHRIQLYSPRKRAEINNLTSTDHSQSTSIIGRQLKLGSTRIVEPDYLFEDSILDLVVFEGSRLLKQFPELNGAFINRDEFLIYEEINFGISFDNNKNLKVLTVKNTDKLNLSEIQAKISELLQLYDSKEPINADLLNNSTVTVTDLSGMNVSFIAPLLNGRQSLILAIARESNHIYNIYAAFDHRISEGRLVSQFLVRLTDRIASYFDSRVISEDACYSCGKTIEQIVKSGQLGLLHVTLSSGVNKHVCRDCFNGW